MSKIGKINISIPEKVKVVLNGNILNIEGPLGKKVLNLDLEMFELNLNDGKKISRIALRQLGLQGKIPGMVKSSW